MKILGQMDNPIIPSWIIKWHIRIVLILIFLLSLFICHAIWKISHPTQPKYFYIDQNQLVHSIIPLDKPIIDDAQLLQWAIRWGSAPFNINYYDYQEQMSVASRHFSHKGWVSFATSFTKQGNIDKIIAAKMLCYAQPTHSAIIKDSTLIMGQLSYDIQFPMIQTCENTNQVNSQNLIIDVVVKRINNDNHPDGLVIDRLIASYH